MEIALVDDLPEERERLRKKLTQQLESRGVRADFSEFESGEDFLEAAKQRPFPVVFLDIYMGGISGMEVAKALRREGSKCQIVFTTTSTDHALEGFQVRALHYLVKPFTDEALENLVEELLERMPSPDKVMRLKAEGSELELSYGDILYAEHYAHMIYVHTTAGRVLATRMPFKTFTAPLREEKRFFICGRGTVVNLEHTVDFGESAFTMEDGSRVQVNQELAKSARQELMEFLLQRGRTV